MKIGAIFILVCSLAYAADEKTSNSLIPTPTAVIPASVTAVMDNDLPNGKGHVHTEIFYRGNTITRIMEFDQKTVAGQTKTGRIFFLGDVTVYETEDDGDKRFRSIILFNDKTKQVEGFIGTRDGPVVPFDVPFNPKTVSATKEQIDAAAMDYNGSLEDASELVTIHLWDPRPLREGPERVLAWPLSSYEKTRWASQREWFDYMASCRYDEFTFGSISIRLPETTLLYVSLRRAVAREAV